MHLDFEYTALDLRELAKVARRNKPAVKKAAKKASIRGWVLFLALSLIVVYLLNTNKPKPSRTVPAVQQSMGWQAIGLEILPWALVTGFVVFLVLGIVYPSEAAPKRKLGDQKLNSMDVDEVGVRSTSGAAETLWRWNAFDRFDETTNGFFLRLTDWLTFVIIPKRAIATPHQIDEMRQILQDRISPPTGAFPVIPLSQ